MIQSGVNATNTDFDAIATALLEAGISTPIMLRSITRETIEETLKVSRPIAETLAAVWRESKSEESQDSIGKVVEALAGVGDKTDDQLIDAYDPTNPKSKVGKELFARHNGIRFVVFRDEQIDREATKEVLAVVKEGHDLGGRYTLEDGTIVDLYSVGQKPQTMFETSPFDQGRALVRGKCLTTNILLNNVSHSIRQFLAVLFDVELCDLTSSGLRREAKTAVQTAELHGMKGLRTDYPEVAYRYDELEREDRLPRLKISAAKASGKGDPFHRKGRPLIG